MKAVIKNTKINLQNGLWPPDTHMYGSVLLKAASFFIIFKVYHSFTQYNQSFKSTDLFTLNMNSCNNKNNFAFKNDDPNLS